MTTAVTRSSAAKVDPLMEWRAWSRRVLVFLLGTTAFAVAYTQWPLYAENQNTKFLHGLATAGFGVLENDWLANTIDPLPAFSGLVAGTYAFLHPAFFYGYHALLLGIYLFSLIGIMNRTVRLNKTTVGPLIFGVIMIALFAGQLPPFSWPVMGTSLSWLLQAGVANQYLINPAFQPSTFGVFLIWSIYLFLIDRPYAAAAVAALAGVMHSTYLPSAAVLTATYMGILLWSARAWGRSLLTGLLALVIVVPVLIYSYLRLGPTSPELWQQAQNIIVHFRIPHHSLPEIWLDRTVYVKIALVLVALLMVRGTRLFVILAVAAFAAVTLTLLQMVWPNDTLAFTAPWRISVFLVPLSSATIIGAAVAWLCNRLAGPAERFRLPVMLLALAVLALLVTQGWHSMEGNQAANRADYRNGLYQHVIADRGPGDVYLVPTEMAEFRLATGAPVLVTFKSHPYKDVEVIEWRNRVDAANGFYGEPTCGRLLDLINTYAITHVVLLPDQLPDGCWEIEPVYADPAFRVAKVKDAYEASQALAAVFGRPDPHRTLAAPNRSPGRAFLALGGESGLAAGRLWLVRVHQHAARLSLWGHA